MNKLVIPFTRCSQAQKNSCSFFALPGSRHNLPAFSKMSVFLALAGLTGIATGLGLGLNGRASQQCLGSLGQCKDDRLFSATRIALSRNWRRSMPFSNVL